MKHEIHFMTAFQFAGRHSFRRTVEGDKTNGADFPPLFRGKLFGPLRARTVFRPVKLNHAAGTLIRPSGADFDPATHRDWVATTHAMAQTAKTWDDVGQMPTYVSLESAPKA